MKNITLKKLSLNYSSEPNTAEPCIKLDENILRLTFPLNYELHNFVEGQNGTIEFEDVIAFRCGGPNDEGYFMNNNEIWNKKNTGLIEWHNFYEVNDTPSDYFKTFYLIHGEIDSISEYRHFVFFMKECTFECLAKTYKEII